MREKTFRTASQFGVNVNQISKWKKEALERMIDIFSKEEKEQSVFHPERDRKTSCQDRRTGG
jgi:transposase-like protein